MAASPTLREAISELLKRQWNFDFNEVLERENQLDQSIRELQLQLRQLKRARRLNQPDPRVLAGRKFTRLLVVGQSDITASNGERKWECRCDCGNMVLVQEGALKRGKTRSCGCLRAEVSSTINRTHGRARTDKKKADPTYSSWRAMVDRCNKPSCGPFKYYGAKGIRVCERWLEFGNFLEDMGERPPGASLDRLNPFSHYSPTNCRWANKFVQANNKRSHFEKRLVFEVC